LNPPGRVPVSGPVAPVLSPPGRVQVSDPVAPVLSPPERVPGPVRACCRPVPESALVLVLVLVPVPA
jgi:hypothetical protein